MPSPSRGTATPLRRSLLPFLSLLLATGIVGTLAAPAAAHPFGDPQTLEVGIDGPEVTVVWKAAPDDYTSLALRLDVVEGPRRMVYKDGAMVPETVDARDAERLADSPALGQYLLSVITVMQADTVCEGSLRTPVDLTDPGAALVFSCPEEVDEVQVAATPLVDLHPAYTTLATGPGGATQVFTVDEVSHVFALEPDGATLRESGATLVAVGGGAAALLGVGAWVARRRRATRRDQGELSC